MAIEATGARFGVDHHSASSVAFDRATVHAIRIAAIAGSVWPANNLAFFRLVAEELLTEVSSFALHARRHLELENIREMIIDGSRWKLAVEVEGIQPESNLKIVIDRILHARLLKVISFERSGSIFTNMGDRVIPLLEILSDRGSLCHACPFGMAYSFLSHREDRPLPYRPSPDEQMLIENIAIVHDGQKRKLQTVGEE